ncbi:MAG: S26 family signal peptidase [Planctomycetales bacterium]|nr:S26 family signal peptidase [Planctomycetales bacterium]
MTAGGILRNPMKVQKIVRLVVISLVLAGIAYFFLRFSFRRLPAGGPVDVRPDKTSCMLVVDRFPSWGREVVRGDIVYYRLPGEEAERPFYVAALAGDALGVDGTRLVVAGVPLIYRTGPALEPVARVPDGHLVLLNQNPDFLGADSRSAGPVPRGGVTARVIAIW